MRTLTFRSSKEEADGEESLLPRALEVPSGSEGEEDGQLPSSALRYLRYDGQPGSAGGPPSGRGGRGVPARHPP